jgi:GMP synthase (glutamine-hydrolysing)
MSILIVKNTASEGPGTIEDFLKGKDMEYSIVDIFDCKAEIPDVREYSHLVVMGGPIAVYEMDDHGFMSFETAMIRAFIKTGKPVLGICLGAQMIAYALGAEVYAGGTKEVGWYKVKITEDGMKDPAISALSVNGEAFAEVFQWHGDTFDLPKNAVSMASSEAYENQAFRYRDNVYALQFHIEVRPDMVREWFADTEGFALDGMMNKSNAIFPEYRKRAIIFYERFFA